MTTLREAAQQALSAIESHGGHLPFSLCQVIRATLRAALAEPTCKQSLQVEPVQEPVAYSVGRTLHWHEGRGISDVQLYATPPQRPAEPVQEPVAWIHTDPDKTRVKFLEWREDEPGYRGRWIKTPLYAVPPQRKPLTEDKIEALFEAELLALPPYPSATQELPVRLARAIEAAHGIRSKT